jgi:glucose/arabinose dehydrogenase
MRFSSSTFSLLFLIVSEIVLVVEGKSSLLSFDEVVSTSRDTSPVDPLRTIFASATATTSTRQLTTYEKATTSFGTIRIDCGADQGYTDKSGHWWQKDNYYSDGTTLSRPYISIEGTDDPTIYKSMRRSSWNMSALVYEIPVVPEAYYTVSLHFAEIVYENTGERKFDVAVEDVAVPQAQGLDILAEAGAMNTELIIRRKVFVADEFLTIRFDPIISEATISGIQVIQTNTPSSTPSAPVAFRSEAPSLTIPALPPTTPPTEPTPPTTRPIAAPTPPVPTPAVPTTPIAPPVAPAVAPTPVAAATPSFESVLINAGGGAYTDLSGRLWTPDSFYSGGNTYAKTFNISGTQDDYLYTSERYGEFTYKFDLPIANYEVVFYFAETFYDSPGQRVFTIKAQNQTVFENVDIMVLASGEQFKAQTLDTTAIVSDGVLLIEFVKVSNSNPKICAIEINLVGPHLAHAVTEGPYSAVDTDDDGFAVVPVDGSQSHTHAPGLSLIEWTWKVDGQLAGTGEVINLTIAVGEHDVTLFVLDDGGNDSADSTTITVFPFGYPAVLSLSPELGSVAGGDQITIIGSGFDYSASQMTVHIGDLEFSGSNIVVVDSTTITVQSPTATLATPVPISVDTPLGTSNAIDFTYVGGAPIEFTQGKVTDVYSPTTVAFGPDEKLYVGTSDGFILKLTLDDDFNVIESVSTSVIADLPGGNRTILGLTFDPMQTSQNPSVYVSHSYVFHGDPNSSSGDAINGKVSKVSGANLDTIVDVISGLPVSDHDHGVNGLEFGDAGELYIQIGGNTNAGVPGRLSSTRLQKDNVLSAATLVAYLADPNFNGTLTYDADDDGNLNPGYGVEVFAAGSRNPYDIVLHSNGYLYGTDNGPNFNLGDRSTGCTPGEELSDIEEPDKINLIRKGAYYGFANRKRGATDPRQCVWHSAYESSTDNHTAPIVLAPSSADGIIEFQTDHFDGQLRGNLIYSMYKKGLFRVILTADGTGVVPQSDPPIELVGNNGLDVTQAPDGRLVDARYMTGEVFYYQPVEAETSKMIVKGVFPRRGGEAGGSNLSIYGVNFSNNSLAVTLGDSDCPVVAVQATKIVCTLPGGSGTVNITVSTATQTSTFQRGYRYISGTPARRF